MVHATHDDASLRREWEKFWREHGVPYGTDVPVFPARRSTVRKFRKLVRQLDEQREYAKQFVEGFVSILGGK